MSVLRSRPPVSALLVFAALFSLSTGCGTTSSSNPVNIQPRCVPSSTPSFAYVLNGAPTNEISMYTVNSCTGALTATDPATVSTAGNPFGGESMAVDPAGRFVYVANLVSNASDLATISMYTADRST